MATPIQIMAAASTGYRKNAKRAAETIDANGGTSVEYLKAAMASETKWLRRARQVELQILRTAPQSAADRQTLVNVAAEWMCIVVDGVDPEDVTTSDYADAILNALLALADDQEVAETVAFEATVSRAERIVAEEAEKGRGMNADDHDDLTDRHIAAFRDLMALRAPTPDFLVRKMSVLDRGEYTADPLAWASIFDDARALSGATA